MPFVEHLHLRMKRREPLLAWGQGRGQVCPCSKSSRDHFYPTLQQSARKEAWFKGKMVVRDSWECWALSTGVLGHGKDSWAPHKAGEQRATWFPSCRPDSERSVVTTTDWRVEAFGYLPCTMWVEWQDWNPCPSRGMKTWIQINSIQENKEIDILAYLSLRMD